MTSWSPIQIALAAESACNIYGALSIYYNPGSILDLILPASTPASTIPAFEAHAQWIAALTLGITPAFLLCIPNGPGQAVARRTLYTTWIGFETLMAITAAYQLSKYGDMGITRSGLYGTMAIFAAFTMLRVLFLFIKPEWLEDSPTSKKKT